MTFAKGALFVLSLVLAAPLMGCGGSVGAGQTATTAGTRAPIAQNAHGQLKFLGAALGDVPLTGAQRGQIERLAADAEARHEPALQARQELMLILAAQVEAGTIDRTALQPKVDAIAAVARSAQSADRAAFEQLHAILTPDQRVAFADAVEARGSRAVEFAAHGGLKQWADSLNLTDVQRDQIKGILTQNAGIPRAHDGGQEHDGHWEGGRRGAKILEAFKADRFVFDEVVPVRDAGQGVETMADRFLTVAAQVLPLLTPRQRATAAARLRDRASARDGESIP